MLLLFGLWSNMCQCHLYVVLWMICDEKFELWFVRFKILILLMVLIMILMLRWKFSCCVWLHLWWHCCRLHWIDSSVINFLQFRFCELLHCCAPDSTCNLEIAWVMTYQCQHLIEQFLWELPWLPCCSNSFVVVNSMTCELCDL